MEAAQIKVGREAWTIEHGPCGGDYGACYAAARRVIIRRGLTPAEDIGAIVHELLHAALPDLSEEAVEKAEYAVMNGLRWGGHIPSDDD